MRSTPDPVAAGEVRVVRGGDPRDPAVLEAIALAIATVARERTADPAPTTPAWARAAILEGVGGRSVRTPGDLGSLHGAPA